LYFKTNNMKGFSSLDLYHKSDILEQQADYLMTVQINQYSVKLYGWDRFFIEQYFDNECEKVTRINIAGTADMRKYLENITLADLK
jgi:hypothetical protein